MHRTLLLVHGAGHGAWCWEMLLPLLAQRGVRTASLDLPGLGSDPTPACEVTFQHYIDAVAALLCSLGDNCVMMGHSMGGWPMSAVAEQHPDRVAKLIYLASFIPQDGESMGTLINYLAGFEEPSIRACLTESLTPGAQEFDRRLAAGVFYNRCTPAVAERAVARLRPQADAPLQANIRLTADRFGAIPKTYIVCAADRALPVGAQQTFSRRDGITRHVLDADHSPFFSVPDELADLLVREVAAY